MATAANVDINSHHSPHYKHRADRPLFDDQEYYAFTGRPIVFSRTPDRGTILFVYGEQVLTCDGSVHTLIAPGRSEQRLRWRGVCLACRMPFQTSTGPYGVVAVDRFCEAHRAAPGEFFALSPVSASAAAVYAATRTPWEIARVRDQLDCGPVAHAAEIHGDNDAVVQATSIGARKCGDAQFESLEAVCSALNLKSDNPDHIQLAYAVLERGLRDGWLAYFDWRSGGDDDDPYVLVGPSPVMETCSLYRFAVARNSGDRRGLTRELGDERSL